MPDEIGPSGELHNAEQWAKEGDYRPLIAYWKEKLSEKRKYYGEKIKELEKKEKEAAKHRSKTPISDEAEKKGRGSLLATARKLELELNKKKKK